MVQILVEKDKLTWLGGEDEHPELARANLPMVVAAAWNCLVVARAMEKELDRRRAALLNYEQEIAKVYANAASSLGKFFPGSLAEGLIDAARTGKKTVVEVKGVVVPGEMKGDHQIPERIYYLFASSDRQMVFLVTKGLFKRLETLPSPQALSFLEHYLAWMGDCENLDEPANLVVSYPKKDITLAALASKNPDSIMLRLSATQHEKPTDQPRNIFYWLDRAKVLKYSQTNKYRDTEVVFGNMLYDYSRLGMDRFLGAP